MRILNIHNLNIGTINDIKLYCREMLKKNKGAFLIPMNPIKVIKARKYADFQEIIDGCDWVFPDAWGLKWAASFLYGKDIPLSPGYSVMFSLIEQAAQANHSIYLLGTTDDVLITAVQELQKIHSRLKIAGTHHGFFSASEEDAIFTHIAELRPDYVFAAMGEYLQEKVIQRLRHIYPKAIYMGVGGSLDLLAGKQPLPPKWIRENHLEWLFRLFSQPFRAPRFKALPIFVFLILCVKIRRCISFTDVG